MLSRFHRIPERDEQTDRQTDGRTDGRTDRQTCYINIARQWQLVLIINHDVEYEQLHCDAIVHIEQQQL